MYVVVKQRKLTLVDPILIEIEMDISSHRMRVDLPFAGEESVSEDAPFAVESEPIVVIAFLEPDPNFGILRTIHVFDLERDHRRPFLNRRRHGNVKFPLFREGKKVSFFLY